MQTKHLPPTWAWIGISLLSAFFLFYRLGTDPLVAWDESRQAINAVEMLQHKNPLFTTFEGKTDTWNTKPSLVVALQAACLSVFGISEFSLRLPSALAAFLLSLVLFAVLYSCTHSLCVAFTGVLFLLSMSGFNGYHVSRTGDFDSLLILFTTLQILSFFFFIEKDKPLFLFFFFFALTAATLTKGVAGLLFLPFFLLWPLLSRTAGRKFIRFYTLLGLLGSSLIVLAYYYYRELHTPSFLYHVYANEIGGRFAKVNMGHHGPWYYYLYNIFFSHAFPWSLLLVVLLIFPFSFRGCNSANRRLSFYLLFAIIMYLLVISIAKTKLAWYDAPVFPLIALLLSLLLFGLFSHATLHKACNISFLLLGLGAAYGAYNQTTKPLPTCEYCIESNQFGANVREGLAQNKNYDGFYWSTQFDYAPIPAFYAHKLRIEKGQIMTQKNWKTWQEGDRGFLLQPQLLDSLQTRYPQLERIETKRGIHEVFIPLLSSNTNVSSH